jgi:hypothetical protein
MEITTAWYPYIEKMDLPRLDLPETWVVVLATMECLAQAVKAFPHSRLGHRSSSASQTTPTMLWCHMGQEGSRVDSRCQPVQCTPSTDPFAVMSTIADAAPVVPAGCGARWRCSKRRSVPQFLPSNSHLPDVVQAVFRQHLCQPKQVWSLHFRHCDVHIVH